jgi:hypothetical protein
MLSSRPLGVSAIQVDDELLHVVRIVRDGVEARVADDVTQVLAPAKDG